MDEIELYETSLRRSWRTTSDIVFAKHSNKKLVIGFWVAEVLGGAVTGAIDGWLAVVWLVCGLLILWVGALASAPFQQRNDARSKVREIAAAASEWLGLEDGGRYYRDLLSGFGMAEGVKMFDSMSSPNPEQPTSSPVASAFRWCVQEAINEGKMEVRGVPENGSERERLTEVDDSVAAYRKSREGDVLFLMMDGVYYRDLQIKKTTIKSYVEYVRSHDAALDTRPK